MLKMFTATIRNGALVLPDGADLGLSEEGDEVQVAVEVADAFDRAGLLFAASRPSQFEKMGGAVTYPEREELQPPRCGPIPGRTTSRRVSGRLAPVRRETRMRCGSPPERNRTPGTSGDRTDNRAT